MFGHQNDQQDAQGQSSQITDQTAPSDITPPQTVQAFANPPAPVPDDSLSSKPADPVVTSPPLSLDGGSAADDTAPVTAATTDANSLLDIKQQALHQLSPLVGHLEQSPEEKFRTTMMMLQASDDQALVKDAYAAAQAITDEKARAQALLDVINEINYFTQPHDS